MIRGDGDHNFVMTLLPLFNERTETFMNAVRLELKAKLKLFELDFQLLPRPLETQFQSKAVDSVKSFFGVVEVLFSIKTFP